MITIIIEGKEYQLDVEQAKKLNLLKEKNNRVKSWDEFKEKYRNVEGYWFDKLQGKVTLSCGIMATCEQLTPHEANAISAFSKLLKLRRDWIGEWKPDWEDGLNKYGIRIWKNRICFEANRRTNASLSFPTEQMAKEFLETFRDLIEDAKILI